MEEDWYSMEWVLAERSREPAAHEIRAARVRAETRDTMRPKPSAGEHRWRWRRVGDIAATGAGATAGAPATGLMLVRAPHPRKHWQRPPARDERWVDPSEHVREQEGIETRSATTWDARTEEGHEHAAAG